MGNSEGDSLGDFISEKIIEGLASEGDYLGLLCIMKDANLPEYSRKKAEEFIPYALDNAIGGAYWSGDYHALERISGDDDIPEYWREKAKKKIPETVVRALKSLPDEIEKAIQMAARLGEYRVLDNISRDMNLPEYLREKAEKKIPEAAEELLEKYHLEINYYTVQAILRDERVPEELRAKARRKFPVPGDV